MTAGVDQDGDRLARAVRLCLADYLDYALGLGGRVMGKEGMEADTAVRTVGLESHGGLVGDRARQDVLLQGECVAQSAIHPVHDGWTGAEINRQREGDRPDGADPALPGLKKEADLRFTKSVNRLHGIAHQEQRPSVIRAPVPDQPGQQAILALGGILKLIDEQVADLIVQSAGQVGWGLVRTQRGPRPDGDLREVDAPFLAKDEPELLYRHGQQEHQRVQHVPLPVIESRSGQRPQFMHQPDGFRVQIDAGKPLFRGVSGSGRRETLVDVESLAAGSLRGQEHLRETDPAGERFGV